MSVGRSDLILHNGYNLACALKSIEAKSEREKLDATVLCSSNRVYEGGFQTGTVSANGVYDSDTTNEDKLTDVISNAFSSGDEQVVSIGNGLFAVGKPAYLFDGCVADWDLPINVGQLIFTNANWTSNNGMMRGRWLMSQQIDAGTVNGTSVDNGAATTNGGLFQVHLENAAVGGATDVDVKLQHSTDDSTWVDLTAVNNLSATHDAGSVRVAAGTTVRRYTRAVPTVTGGDTVLVSAAFARG